MFPDVRGSYVVGTVPLCLSTGGGGARTEERGEEGSWEAWAEDRLQSDSSSLALSQMGRRSWMFVDFFFLMLQVQTVFHFEKPELTASSLAYLFYLNILKT